MLKLINVEKSFKNKKLFENVNINIEKAGIYSFIGNNGSGKTTLLNIIAKFIKPSKGKVVNKINGCSFISQKVNLIDHLRIKDHFKMFKIDETVLKKVRLYNKIDCYPSQLSQGQRQRIMCMLAIYSSYSLLIADEPTSHLDFKSASLIIKELVKASKKKIVLLVSHDLELVDKYSNRIYLIENHRVKLIEDRNSTQNMTIQNKMKFKFKNYIKKSLIYYKKINLFFLIISFISFLLLAFGFNFKNNVDILMENSKKSSLDYNKFYLRECEKIDKEITFKKCSNLSEDKLNLLKNSEHKVGYNYDLLFNSLYGLNNFNVVKNNNFILKEGVYPSKYNQIVANDEYKIGDIITLSASKIISLDETDIYNNELKLEVVGITYNSLINNRNNFYLDYDLVEEYLKHEYLINNRKTLYDYFETLDINDYKYILFFENIDLSLLKYNGIDYISSSYDYYNSLEDVSNKINKCIVYLNIIVIFFNFYYYFRLIKKKIISKESEIIFLKSMGVTKKKINKIIYKENKKLIIISCFLSYILVSVLFYLLFGGTCLSIASLLIILVSLSINKNMVKHITNKRQSI